MSLGQGLATAIFLGMFIAIIVGKQHRYIPALIGAAVTIVVVFLGVMRSPDVVWTVLNLEQLGHATFWLPGHEAIESHGVNWQTIVFIGGMMAMVEGLNEAGFFRWLCLFVAKKLNYRVVPIFIAFMVLSGFLSMFIDSITVLLFLASVTVELGKLLKFDPVPLIIAEIAAANIGGSATMSGDPPNIIIGTAFGYTFGDFAANTGPIAWVGMILVVGLFYFMFRKSLAKSKADSVPTENKYPEPKEAIANRKLFLIQSAIFVFIIILLVTHAETGISVALIGVIAAVLTVLATGKRAPHVVKKLDWRTLLFFVGLFICVGGLEQTGVLEMMAEGIRNSSGGNLVSMMSIILWMSAFLSAIVDNIPFAATMVPVIASLAETTGVPLPTLAWTLALGTDIGGNATPIGASANVVGTAIAEREGYPIGWGRFCKYSFPAMVVVMAVVHLLLVVRYT